MCYVEVEQDSSINAPVKVCICTIRLKNIDAYSPPRGRLLTLSEPYRSPLSHRICDEDHWLFSPLLAFFFKILNILQVVFVYKQLYNIVFWSWHTHILGWVTTLAVNVKTSCRSSYLPCCDYCKQLPPPHRRVSILNYGMRSRDCFGFFFFLSPFFSFGDTQSPPHRRYFNLTYVEFLPEMSNVFRYSCLIRN